MAVTASNAYKGSSYGGKISTPRLPNIGQEMANISNTEITRQREERIRMKEVKAARDANRKAILDLQKQDAALAGKMFDKVSSVKGGGETFQGKQNDYWNNQINEVVKIRQGMQKLPGEDGYIDPVVGAKMITNISNSIDTYTTGMSEAAAEAIELKESLRFGVGEENAISVTNMNLKEAKLLQDWVNGESGVGIISNDLGQTILKDSNGTVFNVDEYLVAKDSDRDMFLRVPEYKDRLTSYAKSRLGGVDNDKTLSTDFYSYTKTDNGGVNYSTLKVNTKAMEGLVDEIAKTDTTIRKMAEDPIYGKVYWADVLEQDTEWTGSDAQKAEMRQMLAQESVDMVRKLNGTERDESIVGNPKIYKPSSPRGSNNKNNPVVGNTTFDKFVGDVNDDINPMVEDLTSSTPGELQEKFETYKENYNKKLKNATIEKSGDDVKVYIDRVTEQVFNDDGEEVTQVKEPGTVFNLGNGKGYRNFIEYLEGGKFNSKDNMKFGPEIESYLDNLEKGYNSSVATKSAISKNTTTAVNLVKEFQNSTDQVGRPVFTTTQVMRGLGNGTFQKADSADSGQEKLKALFGKGVFDRYSGGDESIMYPINPFLNKDYGKGVREQEGLFKMTGAAPLMQDIISIVNRAKNYPQFADLELTHEGDPIGITLKDLFTDKATTASQRYDFYDAYQQIVLPYINAVANGEKLPLQSFIK